VIPREILAILPKREDCTNDAVRKAMQFLCDEWLVDVTTDFTGKATLITAALTIIERSLLPDRPVYFITGGRRGAGKTTTIKMLVLGVTGIEAAASAWSTNEEERRKALLAYFMYGVPYILWDNIKRGSTVSCPHIEKSCTSAYYADRKLGVSEMVATAASSIHIFTGAARRADEDPLQALAAAGRLGGRARQQTDGPEGRLCRALSSHE
jgi:hypothetical protein